MVRVLIKYLMFLLFFLKGSIIFSQYSKEVIYLKLNIDNECFRKMKFYKSDEKGIVFNLLCKGNGSFLFPDKEKADTLCIKHIKDYPITTMEQVDKKVKDFRLKTYKKRPPNKKAKLYQAYTKNDIFKTYLIEIIGDDKFVIYPVTWRNQNITD